MQLDLDVTGRAVLVLGTARGTRLAVARLVRGGARVTLVATDAGAPPGPDPSAPFRVVRAPDADDSSRLLRLLGPAWLVVSVDPPRALRERVEQLAARLRVLTTTQEPAAALGRVTLVGGGPGPTGLLTLEGAQALAAADVVFHDRLAPTDDLPDLAPSAELVDVGKTPYHHPVDQRSIEELLVDRARRGQSVVRLKGGDPFVFGRGGEEVLACLAAGVPVRVVPGVSSAVAVPASAGIPVTHRGLSHAFTVISGHQRPTEDELDALARLGGTVVVLMGVVNLEQIARGLVRAGLDPATPAAVVERGWSDSQRSTFSSLATLADDARRLQVASPAVVVIGDVVRLAADRADASLVLDGLPAWTAP
ncbi:uroporphyrinogen-III C-methyltransferase [Microlunatus flavus]|uniref:uroporphyrinogen-III C-methyltransferase n=1 Tax=Microlunatus flavus TaxID=1036181 RepID=A0A1H9F9E3_9ACTN|nr:uroporphyrinogen-III C-methyltransferase [Microlunatus flavus]SEQ34580.1 uroporphyrin-III C-methyltransferase [Microlunatus flavus]